MIVPIFKQVEKEILEQISHLKSLIDDFDTPLTEEDYIEKFKS